MSRDVYRNRQLVRALKVLRELQTSRLGLRVEDLHARVDERCHRRTIYRDLDALQAAGFPITRTDDGRWRLWVAA